MGKMLKFKYDYNFLAKPRVKTYMKIPFMCESLRQISTIRKPRVNPQAYAIPITYIYIYVISSTTCLL